MYRELYQCCASIEDKAACEDRALLTIGYCQEIVPCDKEIGLIIWQGQVIVGIGLQGTIGVPILGDAYIIHSLEILAFEQSRRLPIVVTMGKGVVIVCFLPPKVVEGKGKGTSQAHNRQLHQGII